MLRTQQQQPQKPFSFNEWANILYLVAASFAACVTPFFRHRFGRDSFGLNILGAFLIMYTFTSMYPHHDLIQLFFLLWIAATLFHRFRSTSLTKKGAVHSRSGGYPWLGYLLPWVKTYKGALGMEMLMAFLIGVVLLPHDEPLGTFIIFGGVAAAIKHGVESDLDRGKLTRMRDAEIEHRDLMDRYRRGDF